MSNLCKSSVSKISKPLIVKKQIAAKTIKKETICAAIRSNDEPQFKCLMRTKYGEKYCPMHLIQKKIVDFNQIDDDLFDIDQKIFKSSRIIKNDIIRKISLDNFDKKKTISNKIVSSEKTNFTMYEQKVSTVETSHKENEDELETKLLILVNDEEYRDIVSKLIGPVFNDVTLSEDEQDPITFDEIWTMKNGIKIPASVNKYFLFSYIDSKNKIRCLTIFTMYSMINENNLIHPITMESISKKDIKRAKRLINLYQTKIGLFKEDNSKLSPEFKLRNRITKLFKSFHIHNIYLEEKWLLEINDKAKLYKIISETEKLISHNNNPKINDLLVFKKKDTKKKYDKSIPKKHETASKNDDDNNIFELHEYIVGEWEKLIRTVDSSQNQIPIWILASGLSFVVPEVIQKYPNLGIMLY